MKAFYSTKNSEEPKIEFALAFPFASGIVRYAALRRLFLEMRVNGEETHEGARRRKLTGGGF
jgi:hypothetical protein